MSSLLRRVALVLVATAVSGCVSDSAHQNGAVNAADAPVDMVAGSGYVLAHVEFDDQGWFHDTRQRQALFDRLHALKAQGRAMLIVTYAHGWKHNAAENDDNLRHFRQLLGQLDKVEQGVVKPGGPRTVVGVYIGWRGASLAIPGLDNLTFWLRKGAAERVGSRSVKQLFMELNQFRTIANGWDTPDKFARAFETQLIFIGHSFGGLITYHALYSEILERGLQVDKWGTYQPARSFGDFVLLVNPAFEGAAYEPIWRAAILRGCYPTGQKPVMAIVTSSADWVTRYGFPLGRLYTYFQSAPLAGERETLLHTVGHLERYRTHRLTTGPAAAGAIGTIGAIGDYRMVETNPVAPARMPYLVIQVGADLIAGHSDFWNDRFRDFTVDFITSQLLAKKTFPADDAGARPPQRGECPAFMGHPPMAAPQQ